MTDKEKLELLAEAMDVPVEELNETDELKGNIAWDSLSMLAFMASVSSKCGKKIHPSVVLDAVTVRDALNLIP